MSIARTKLEDRILPNYSRQNEIFNMVTHIVGGGFALVTLVTCIIVSGLKGDGWGITSSTVFGISMVVLYTMSSVYHGLINEMAKKVMQVLDHCTIYFLIAGTYTPFCLCSLRPAYPAIGWIIFGVVWTLAIIATVFTAIDLRKYRVFSMICYLGMGWCIIFFIGPLRKVLAPAGIQLLVSGGIVYTLGSIVYGIGSKKPWVHGIFHLFVILGSILHSICILRYVLPVR